MADRTRRSVIGAGSVTALLLPLLAWSPAAADDPLAVTAPAATSASVGTPTPVPGASISGLEGAEVVRVLARVGSGTLSVPATADLVAVPAGYPALGAEGAALALEGTQDALNGALAGLRWTAATPGPVAVTIDASPAGAAFDPDTGHFYQVVSPPERVAWTDARDAAASTHFLDQAGYLATITGADEQAVMTTVTPGSAWIGGRRQQGSTWTWATGPEAGEVFWTSACGVGQQGPCSANNGATFAWWAPAEPRSLPGASFTNFLGGTGGGQWVPSANTATPESFIVEFGGTAGDPTVETAHADVTLDATGGFADGISPLVPAPGATPIRSTPTTEPTTTTTAPVPETTVPVPETTVPVPDSPVPTAPPATTPATTPDTAAVITAASVDTAAVPDTSIASDPGTTVALAMAAGASAVDGVPVYIVFDVGVGTPLAEVRVTVRGYRLSPSSTVTVVAHSSPEIMGVGTVDEAGNVVASMTLPAGIGDGEHTVVATATAADGSPVERQMAFALAAGRLSRIGPPDVSATTTSPPTTVTTTSVAAPPVADVETSDSSGALPVALIVTLLAAVVGAILWLVARRRKANIETGDRTVGSSGSGDSTRPDMTLPQATPVDQFH